MDVPRRLPSADGADTGVSAEPNETAPVEVLPPRNIDLHTAEMESDWRGFPLHDLIEIEPDMAGVFLDQMLQVVDVNSLLNFRLVSKFWRARLERRKSFWKRVQGRVLSRKPKLAYPGVVPDMDFPFGRVYCLPLATVHITPLHLAAFYGNLELCKNILSCLEDKNPAEKETGWTPLHYAVAGCPEDNTDNGTHLKICQLILSHLCTPGASNSSVLPITKCAFTTSPLHIAASSGKLDICKLFCERIEMKRPLDARGRTPTYLAKWRNVWAKQSSDEPLKLKETIAYLTSLPE